MKIVEILDDRDIFLDFLLLGDEDLSMLNKYKSLGRFWGLDHGGIKSTALVLESKEDQLELKNLSTLKEYQSRGYGSYLVKGLFSIYGQLGYKEMIVGTGETPSTLRFYKSLGFEEYNRLEDFFTKNYPAIIEKGVLLKDMIYLKKSL